MQSSNLATGAPFAGAPWLLGNTATDSLQLSPMRSIHHRSNSLPLMTLRFQEARWTATISLSCLICSAEAGLSQMPTSHLSSNLVAGVAAFSARGGPRPPRSSQPSPPLTQGDHSLPKEGHSVAFCPTKRWSLNLTASPRQAANELTPRASGQRVTATPMPG